jgi:hypothetical protein
MTFALYLLDSEADDITKKKRLRIDRVTKLLKVSLFKTLYIHVPNNY